MQTAAARLLLDAAQIRVHCVLADLLAAAVFARRDAAPQRQCEAGFGVGKSKQLAQELNVSAVAIEGIPDEDDRDRRARAPVLSRRMERSHGNHVRRRLVQCSRSRARDSDFR